MYRPNFLDCDTVQIQPWIPYSKHSVMCLRLVVDIVSYMAQPWVFYDEFLPRDAFSQIEVLMDDGFDPILLMGNSARSGQVMHGMFWAAKKVYLECILGLIWSLLMNDFGSLEVQSWLGLIKMLGSNQIYLRLIF